MARLTPVLLNALVVGLVVLVPACGDDGDATTTTTNPTFALGESLAVGDTYEDPTGGVTLTLHGTRETGDLLVADAEACTREDGPSGLPIELAAWQLRLRGQEAAVTRTVLDDPPRAARPPWPERLALAPGECFRGKVPFELAEGARAQEILFTQLGHPVAWTVRS